MTPYAANWSFPRNPHQFIVVYQVPNPFVGKGHKQVFTEIFSIDCYSRLELHLQRLFAVLVVSQKVGALPVRGRLMQLNP